MRLIVICICALLSACVANLPIISKPTPAFSQTKPNNTPIPQIDGGGHTSLIRDIAFTQDGRYLVSASDDKLIRIWDIQQQKTVRTLRGQMGDGDEGKIYAMALSPDERYLAVGGIFHHSNPILGSVIRLYNFQTGELLALLKGHSNVVNALAFSPDGRWLISGDGDSNAIIWNLQTRQQHQVLKGHTDDIYAVAFTPDNQRVVTGSFDHDLRLWHVADGELIETLGGHTDKVYAVAITPDNQIISGSWDRSIRRWDGMDGRYLNTLVADQGKRIGSLSISPNGHWLLSGSGARFGPFNSYLYRLSDGKRLQRYTGHDNIVLATAFSADNSWVATAGGNDHSIHLWNPQTGDEPEYKLSGAGQAIWSVGFSAGGRYLAWGKGYNEKHINHRGPLAYQIRLPESDLPLGSPQTLPAIQANTFRRAQTQQGTWRLQHQKGGNYGGDAILAIQQNGKTQYRIQRDPTNGYQHRSYTFTPDGQHIISGGSNGVLSYYNRTGEHLANFVGHTGDVMSVAVSADERFLVSGAADQTVRLWRIDTQELLLTLFHGKDDWVAWTPQGYFTASPGGEDMLGWHINRGPDKAADYVSGRQLREHFYRPYIVDQAIRLGSAREAVAQAGRTDFTLDDLLAAPPPKFRIKETEFLPTAGEPLLRVALQVDPGTVQSYRVYLDGRYIKALDATRSNHKTKHDVVLELAVPSGKAQRSLRIEARDAQGLMDDQETQVTVPQGLFKAQAEVGDLYVLSIGVNDYPYLKRNLHYAKQDAAAFHHWLMQNHAGRFKQVHEFLLHDDAKHKPTRWRIQKALAKLANAKPNDTVVVFLAGHGENLGKDYYFLSSNTEPGDKGFVPETAIKWQTIQDSLSQAKGQRILVVDTCYAKGAFNSMLINNASAADIALFSATDSADYVAEEKSSLGHGVLTYSLLQGLQGEADSAKRPDQKITLTELESFVVGEVMHHTNGRQRPAIHLGQDAKHYVIARLGNAE